MNHRPSPETVLSALSRTIAERRGAPGETSYTAKLLSQGIEKCAKKFGEEAVELALAAMTGDKDHVRAEAGDVLYHLLVLLEACGVGLDDVANELSGRFGTGGLVEKASRNKPAT